jgi:hypothetical protein
MKTLTLIGKIILMPFTFAFIALVLAIIWLSYAFE